MLLYVMIIFFKSYRQPAGALWLSLYCMKCKRHVIALLYRHELVIVVEEIVGETTVGVLDSGSSGVQPRSMGRVAWAIRD